VLWKENPYYVMLRRFGLPSRSICVTNDQGYVSFVKHNPVLSSFMTYHRVCDKSNTTGATCGAGTAFLSGAHEFIRFSGVRAVRSLFFYVMLCRSLFVLLAIVLSVLRLTASDYLPLVSSNSSFNCICGFRENEI